LTRRSFTAYLSTQLLQATIQILAGL